MNENKPKIIIDFKDILALIFILLSVGIILTGIWVVADGCVSELGGNIISGAIATFGTLMTLIVQYYFRKKPAESDGDK